MLLRPTIPARPETDPAFDQAQLFERGLAAIRRLSRHLWTDHNLHDPGITQLEILAYALTELAYRTQFPLEDLLAAADDNDAAMEPLFAKAADILPNAPVTLADYRKLLIDLEGVRNAWLRPVPLTLFASPATGKLQRQASGDPGERAITIAGRHQAIIEYMDEVRSAAQRDAIGRKVLARLHEHRALGMDFVAPVLEVQPAWFSLCAEIDLSTEADIAQVAADIRFAVDRFLAPPVRNYTLDEMLARRHDDGTPWTVAEIHQGPLLANGFIPDDELAAAELRSEIRLSDVISVIMDLPGVLAIRDILMNPLGADGRPHPTPDRWRLPVAPGHQPRLAASVGRLGFRKKDLPVIADAAEVELRLARLREGERRKLESGFAGSWDIPSGRHRNPAAYRSMQSEFPSLYGLSAAGLSPAASPQRQAEVLQLKGWLTFFDHILAGYAAQLAHVRELFSARPGLTESYFCQQVTSYPDWQKIYPDWQQIDPEKSVHEHLAQVVEPGNGGLIRRNRFLDHLLARHAEDFADYVAVMQGRFGITPTQAAQAKCRFLAACAQIGGTRGLAANACLQPSDEPWKRTRTRSGLERRIAHLLDIAEPARSDATGFTREFYMEIDKVPDDAPEYRFRLRHPLSRKILLSSSTHYATLAAARAELEQAIVLGQLPGAYARARTGTAATPDGQRRWYFNIVDASGEVIARRIEFFRSEAAMEAAIAELIAQLRAQYGGERLHVIEHLLLLGDDPDDPLMESCVDPGCADPADLDPYSHRLSILLPADAGRFRDADFRRFAEATLRAETPAHLLPRICWVDAEDMARIERAHRDWLAVRCGAPGADAPARLARLIDALSQAKNVHPPAALHPCGQLDPPPFILGRAALGSATDFPEA